MSLRFMDMDTDIGRTGELKYESPELQEVQEGKNRRVMTQASELYLPQTT